MGTLRKVKRKMKMDKDFRKTLVRSAKDEILIDVDGDGQPDVSRLCRESRRYHGGWGFL